MNKGKKNRFSPAAVLTHCVHFFPHFNFLILYLQYGTDWTGQSSVAEKTLKDRRAILKCIISFCIARMYLVRPSECVYKILGKSIKYN